MFIVLLSGIVNASNNTKCVLWNNQKCKIQPTLIILHPNEHSQEFHFYPFTIKLDRCASSCNILNDLSNQACISNKTEESNLRIFNMTTNINECKTVTKHISGQCKCKFDGTEWKSSQWWNSTNCQCECKKIHVCEKDYVWNPATCNCENGIY